MHSPVYLAGRRCEALHEIATTNESEIHEHRLTAGLLASASLCPSTNDRADDRVIGSLSPG